MRCSEFLHGYTDFRDETIDDPLVRRRFIAHVSLCGRCARYQEVIDLGVSLLRSADQIEISPRFHRRLARRLQPPFSTQNPSSQFQSDCWARWS